MRVAAQGFVRSLRRGSSSDQRSSPRAAPHRRDAPHHLFLTASGTVSSVGTRRQWQSSEDIQEPSWKRRPPGTSKQTQQGGTPLGKRIREEHLHSSRNSEGNIWGTDLSWILTLGIGDSARDSRRYWPYPSCLSGGYRCENSVPIFRPTLGMTEWFRTWIWLSYISGRCNF